MTDIFLNSSSKTGNVSYAYLNTWLTTKTTDNLLQGSSNLYFTSSQSSSLNNCIASISGATPSPSGSTLCYRDNSGGCQFQTISGKFLNCNGNTLSSSGTTLINTLFTSGVAVNISNVLTNTTINVSGYLTYTVLSTTTVVEIAINNSGQTLFNIPANAIQYQQILLKNKTGTDIYFGSNVHNAQYDIYCLPFTVLGNNMMYRLTYDGNMNNGNWIVDNQEIGPRLQKWYSMPWYNDSNLYCKLNPYVTTRAKINFNNSGNAGNICGVSGWQNCYVERQTGLSGFYPSTGGSFTDISGYVASNLTDTESSKFIYGIQPNGQWYTDNDNLKRGNYYEFVFGFMDYYSSGNSSGSVVMFDYSNGDAVGPTKRFTPNTYSTSTTNSPGLIASYFFKYDNDYITTNVVTMQQNTANGPGFPVYNFFFCIDYGPSL